MSSSPATPSLFHWFFQLLLGAFCFPIGIAVATFWLRSGTDAGRRLGKLGLGFSTSSGLLCLLPFFPVGMEGWLYLTLLNFAGMLLCFPCAILLYAVEWRRPGLTPPPIRQSALQVGLLALILFFILTMMIPDFIASRSRNPTGGKTPAGLNQEYPHASR